MKAFDIVFKHLPWDPANVNTLKTMVDPYILASKLIFSGHIESFKIEVFESSGFWKF